MKTLFVGREQEEEELRRIYKSECPAIVVVHGRRRIGKTTLIENTFAKEKVIKIEGLENKSQQDQLDNFVAQMSHRFKDLKLGKLKLDNWSEAFIFLNDYVRKGRWIVYLEELQWMANYESALISELKLVWDNYLSKNKKLLLVLCGSSPSFMIEKVMRSQALHNRSQFEMPVRELGFESASKLLPKKMSFDEKLDSYLALGGIPLYLKYLHTDSSTYLSLLKNSFKVGSFFSEEADRIFVSSLNKNPNYKGIIEYLAKVKNATRGEICEKLGLDSGGHTTRLFHDLEQCGFVGNYSPFSWQESKRESKYYISDNYLQFYYRFIAPRISKIRRGDYNHSVEQALSHQNYRQWLGYSFERLCLKNHQRIAHVLGFENVEYDVGPYYLKSPKAKGVQFDLAYKRKDRTIVLCEIKYRDQQPDFNLISEVEKKISALNLENSSYSLKMVLISLKPPTKKLLDSGYFMKILSAREVVE